VQTAWLRLRSFASHLTWVEPAPQPPTYSQLLLRATMCRAPRCVLSGLRPQLLDPTLRTTQAPVDQKRVGVGSYLRRDPPRQAGEGSGQGLSNSEDPLQARESDLYLCCLAPGRLLERSVTKRMPKTRRVLPPIARCGRPDLPATCGPAPRSTSLRQAAPRAQERPPPRWRGSARSRSAHPIGVAQSRCNFTP
jgi:hypothetical protein